jgi:hypothetical protein
MAERSLVRRDLPAALAGALSPLAGTRARA